MRFTWLLLLSASIPAAVALADWPTFGADPQRTSWARYEKLLDPSNVATLELKWKVHLDNAPKELTSLAAPIVAETANGVVFALSSGEDVRQVDEAGNGHNTAERLAGSGKAVLYAFDAETGKELFNSGDTLTSFTHFGGLAVSNGRVFVTTWDGYVYAFGRKQEDR